jgi:putative Ca2+/H+ antiporter (TMEM165/GDT1 family)
MKHRFILLCLALSLLSVIVQADAAVESHGSQGGEGKKPQGAFSAFVQSFSSIVVSEIGDKTFFIAAIMAMRYNRLAVLAGALLALFLMTGISTAFGYVVPKIIPPSVTHILITILFFFFGGKLLYDAYTDDGSDNNEQEEVEIELNQLHSKLVKSSDRADPHQEAEIENITGHAQKKASKADMESNLASPTKKKEANCATKINHVQSKLVFWQALTMTFLGEWGDRSQITTIALAADSSALFVFVGAFLGHCLCTGFAVVGGKYLSDKISERTVNLSGGILFLLFGIHNLFMKSA